MPAALPVDCDLAALVTLAIDTVSVSVLSFGLLHRLIAAAPSLRHFRIERLHSVRYGGDQELGSTVDLDETTANIAKALAQRHLLSLRITELGDDRTGGFTADLMPSGLLLGVKVHQFYGHAHSIGTLSRPDSPLRRLTLAIQPMNYHGGEIWHLIPSATEEVIRSLEALVAPLLETVTVLFTKGSVKQHYGKAISTIHSVAARRGWDLKIECADGVVDCL